MSNNFSQQSHLGHYAGFVTRLIAWLIDHLILVIVYTIVSFIGNIVVDTFGFEDLMSNIVLGIVIFVNIVIYWSYNIGFWMLAGQTPGKAALGVRIIRTDGQRMNIRRGVIRLVGYWVSAILLLGYLWVLVDNRRQGFHDKLARTFVVYSWPEVESEPQIRPLRDKVRSFRSQQAVDQKSE